MTALRKYARLETTGLWRPVPDAQRREVVVSFGEASLVLTDGRTQMPLSHWSLPAVQRRNPGAMPAVFAPGADAAAETIEIDDTGMIEAIETVRSALARRRPRRGRGRLAVVGATLAVVLAGALFWLPGAVVGHTTRVVPFVKREQIGRELLVSMARFTGTPCADPQGLAVLGRLSARLFGPGGAQVVVLRDGLAPGATAHVPGRHLLVDRQLVELPDGPEVLAGHLIAEKLRIDRTDPLAEVLHAAGLRATFTLLATGALPSGALDGQAQARLLDPPAELPAGLLLERFAAAGVPATPYALSLASSSAAARTLTERDPIPPGTAKPLMPDADWLALQAICAR